MEIKVSLQLNPRREIMFDGGSRKFRLDQYSPSLSSRDARNMMEIFSGTRILEAKIDGTSYAYQIPGDNISYEVDLPLVDWECDRCILQVVEAIKVLQHHWEVMQKSYKSREYVVTFEV